MEICGGDFFSIKSVISSSFPAKIVAIDDIRNFDRLRVVLLLTDILRAIDSFTVVCNAKP